jgi:hypothetical protein
MRLGDCFCLAPYQIDSFNAQSNRLDELNQGVPPRGSQNIADGSSGRAHACTDEHIDLPGPGMMIVLYAVTRSALRMRLIGADRALPTQTSYLNLMGSLLDVRMSLQCTVCDLTLVPASSCPCATVRFVSS